MGKFPTAVLSQRLVKQEIQRTDKVAISRQKLFLFNNNKGLEAVPDLQLYLGVLKHRAPLARESHSPAKKKTAVYMYV
jgi:hypothetical protein